MVSTEINFENNEIFFSKTDTEGVIEYGNEVFTRVCEFEISEMVGQPHNLIRHHDMPKEAFQVLWSYLKKEKPVVAYVKNKTKNGHFYWVFALAVPLEKGYLSIRIKPNSVNFQEIVKVYEIANNEEAKNNGQIAGVFGKALKNLGYKTYTDFMIDSLSLELNLRAVQQVATSHELGSMYQEYIDKTKEITALEKITSEISSHVANLNKGFASMKNVSISLLAILERYGAEAAPMKVIIESFSSWNKEIEETLNQFIKFNNNILKALKNVRFKLSIHYLEKEMAETFKQESTQYPDSKESAYVTNLNILSKESMKESSASIKQMESTIRSFNNSYSGLKNSFLVIKIIKINSRMEYSRIGKRDNNIESGIANIDNFVESVSENFTHLESLFRSIDKFLAGNKSYQ